MKDVDKVSFLDSPVSPIQPLATQAEAWQAIPGVSDWVLGIIKQGYTLQFALRPPQFGCVVSISVQRSNAHVLYTEVMSLLAKGAVEMVSLAQSVSHNPLYALAAAPRGLQSQSRDYPDG